MNTLQLFMITYLVAGIRHNCDISKFTKVYFIELSDKIKCYLFEDKFVIKTFRNVKDFLPEDW